MNQFRKGMIVLAMAGALAGSQAVAAQVAPLAPWQTGRRLGGPNITVQGCFSSPVRRPWW